MDEQAKRVLIVDDASLVRRYYRDILERAGFEVEEALNGLEALEKVLDRPVDLLIVDVNMPQMDGFTFLETLRGQDDDLASTPALVTSTECAPEDFEAARNAGANFYIVKPVRGETFAALARLICGVPQ